MDEDIFDQIERSEFLTEPIVRKISEAIIIGILKPGDRLIEVHLADQLGVSRGPIREAFQRLEQLGLVEKVPHYGTFVSKLTQRDIEELNTIRELLESLAARLVAQEQDPEVISDLQEILSQMQLAAVAGERESIVELDAEFHDTLVRSSSHHLLNELWEIITVRMRRFLMLKEKRLYTKLEEAAALHAPIIEAISRGDPDAAAEAVRSHILAASEIPNAWGNHDAENLET